MKRVARSVKSTGTTMLCAVLATSVGASSSAVAGATSQEAGADGSMATEVHGRFACGPSVATGMPEVFHPTIVEMSDPRLDGAVTLSRTTVEYPADGIPADETPSVEAITWHIANAGGAWEGSYLTFGASGEGPQSEIITLAGAGDYEGMSAILESTWLADDAQECGWNVRGLVLDGAVPSFPRMPVD